MSGVWLVCLGTARDRANGRPGFVRKLHMLFYAQSVLKRATRCRAAMDSLGYSLDGGVRSLHTTMRFSSYRPTALLVNQHQCSAVVPEEVLAA